MSENTDAPQRVFIIHGRNLAAVEQLSRFLRALGLEPWRFDQVSGELGANPFIGDVVSLGLHNAQVVIALFTPDERAALQTKFYAPEDRERDRRRFQSRPNVFVEAGMALAHAPERTIMVVAGDVELPSDFGGRLMLRLSNTEGPRRKLRDVLHAAGCIIADGDAFLDSKQHGDFSDTALFGVEVPRLNESETKKIDVLLGSGGVLGIAFAGALQALKRNGYEIEHVFGVSVGALIAAAFAAHADADGLVALVQRGDIFEHIRPPSPLQSARALLPPFAAARRLEDDFYQRALDGNPRFNQLAVKLGIAALDIRNARLLAYTSERHPTMPVADALRLSTAVPFFFPWVTAGERLIVDAAIQTQMPLWLLGSLHEPLKNRVVAFSVSTPRAPTPGTFGEYANRLFEASGLASDHLEVLQSRRLIRIPIHAERHHFLDRLNLDQREVLIEQGRNAVEEAIERGDFTLPDRPGHAARRGSSDVHDLAEEEASNAAIRYARELQRFATELDDE
jgi:predicted acylesterase/phospholipase RssA